MSDFILDRPTPHFVDIEIPAADPSDIAAPPDDSGDGTLDGGKHRQSSLMFLLLIF